MIRLSDVLSAIHRGDRVLARILTDAFISQLARERRRAVLTN